MSTPALEQVDTSPVEGGPQEPATQPEPQVGPNGFPLNTKPEAMEPGHAAAYWRHEARKQQDFNKANVKRIKELEPAAQQLTALEEASRTEAERAADAARAAGEKAGRDAAAAEALGRFAPRLVGAEFRAQLAGRMTAEQISDVVDGLNLTKFLTDDGETDVEAVSRFVSAIPAAAATAPEGQSKPAVRDIGGGSRQPAKVDGLQRGSDLYAARHGKRAATT